MKIVTKQSKQTFYKYRGLFTLVGFEVEDIINISRVYLVEFLGLFSMEQMPEKYKDFVGSFNRKNSSQPTEEDIQDKNKANLTLFLWQRFEDLIRVCKQKAKDIKGMSVAEYDAFYGAEEPPYVLRLLLENHKKYGYKKLDISTFKAIKKNQKIKTDKPFKFSGYWHVGIKKNHRSLTFEDLAGSNSNMYDNICYKNPEELLFDKIKENDLENKKKRFKAHPKETRVGIVQDFILKNGDNPLFKKEVETAKKYIANMRE
jgi:hypothetical protein